MYARDQAVIATPIGAIVVTGDDANVLSVSIRSEKLAQSPGYAAPVCDALEQLEQWFAGERFAFDLPLQPAATVRGTTLRQGLVDVGYGDTISYGGLARLLRSAPRAIGQLCARNPFPIIVPCHRVLASGGQLGAYSAGDGPATKAWLLEHEQRQLSKGASS